MVPPTRRGCGHRCGGLKSQVNANKSLQILYGHDKFLVINKNGLRLLAKPLRKQENVAKAMGLCFPDEL